MEKGEQPRALLPVQRKTAPDVCKGFSAGKKRGILDQSKFKEIERNTAWKEIDHVER